MSVPVGEIARLDNHAVDGAFEASRDSAWKRVPPPMSKHMILPAASQDTIERPSGVTATTLTLAAWTSWYTA